MAGEVITVYTDQQPPESWDASVLIGGSVPGSGSIVAPWQSVIITLLRERWESDGRLVVFVPDSGNRAAGDVLEEPVDWHSHPSDVADVVMFWWPEDADPSVMFACLAACTGSQRVVHGAPSGGPQSRYLLKYADVHPISAATTLAEIVNTVLDKIGSGARRVGGERQVPLPVWRTDSFQRWYTAQTSAGNTLLDARLVWTFSAGSDERHLVYWALHVRMYVQSEDRVKSERGRYLQVRHFRNGALSARHHS